MVLKNGDHLTGEIKSLERGKLRFKTDDMGTLEIEWDNVRQVMSRASFTFELQDGSEYLGSLDASTQEGMVLVVTKDASVDLDPMTIIRMAPIKSGFWERMDGSLSMGASYTQSSDVGQFNFSADARSRTVTHQVSFTASSIMTRQPDAGSTGRDDLEGGYLHFLKDRWLAGGLFTLQRNEDLGIDLRALAAAGMGRHLVQTYRSELSVLGGFAVNEEFVSGAEPSGTSVEALLAGKYSFYKYDAPESDLSLGLVVFPGLTEWGRVRAEFDARLRHEIIKDFFFDISLFDSFDNHPPTAGVLKNDWGLVTSIGWTF